MKVAFAGAFAERLIEAVRPQVAADCMLIALEDGVADERLADIDVLVTLLFTPAMGRAAGRLKLLQVPGAGLDRIDRSALRPGVPLANAYGHDNGIAEHIIGAMLALLRDFVAQDAALRRGQWPGNWMPGAPVPPPSPELAGRTLGILGYGHIGQRLARIAGALDMRVQAIRRNPAATAGSGVDFLGGPAALPQVLAAADCLAITVPLDPGTRGMIGAAELALMKPSAIIVNVARAQVIDEAALYEALAARRIAGAALDVWYRYPDSGEPTLPSALPFHELPNVLMTPHVSGWTDGMLASRAATIAGNIGRVARGEPAVNLVE